MGSYAKDLQDVVRGDEGKTALEQGAASEMKVTQNASASPGDAALVAVLRIFATRGRALREQREQSKGTPAEPLARDAADERERPSKSDGGDNHATN